MTVELERSIQGAVERYDPGDHPLAPRLLEIVAEHRMLPLFFDMAECLGIRADLTVWGALWEDWGERRVADGPRRVEDPMTRDMVILHGLDLHPELAALLPPRPMPAPQCPACDGTGRKRSETEQRCAVCHGLCWIPERWNDSPHFEIDLAKLSWV